MNTSGRFFLFVMPLLFAFASAQKYTAIPDTGFEQALSLYDDIPGDHKVPTANIENLDVLNVSGFGIYSLQGIEDFKSLVSLDCSNNSIEMLDLSTNTKLETLKCNKNDLELLDVSKNKGLKELLCSENKLSTLNLSENDYLAYLYCDNNRMVELDLSNNKELKYLYCQFNRITRLDLSKQKKLVRLFCQSNQLIELNIKNGNNKNLVSFFSQNNANLKSILVDDNIESIGGNTKSISWITNKGVIHGKEEPKFTNIPDIKFEQALVDFGIDKSKAIDGRVATEDIQSLLSLDVSGKGITNLSGIQDFTSLRDLNCSDNLLSSLDMYELSKLSSLNCSGNFLTTLLLVKNKELVTLDCSANKLTVLDVTQNSKLQNLNCSGNQLSDLNLTKNSTLVNLVCSGNQFLNQTVIKGVSVKF